jgi:hypothetical protein
MNVIGRCELNIDLIKAKMPQLIVAENTAKDGRPYWKHIYSVWATIRKAKTLKK